MDTIKNELISLEKQGLLEFTEHPLLGKYSSFRIGGRASYAVFPKTEEGLAQSVSLFKNTKTGFRVLGASTNILFPDEGFDGAILFTRDLNKISFENDLVTAGAGLSFTVLSSKAQKESLSGLEFAYGIPGSTGGAVYMNAGAYGHSVSDVLESSRYMDLDTLVIKEKDFTSHEYAYRQSSYMGENAVILSGTFLLKKGDASEIKKAMNDCMTKRKNSQPLEYPNAGSIFKRKEGYITAKLIDEAGLKGYSVGGAQISEKHAGFIVNKGNATAKDVKTLIEFIEKRIFELHGIHIERELIYFN